MEVSQMVWAKKKLFLIKQTGEKKAGNKGGEELKGSL